MLSALHFDQGDAAEVQWNDHPSLQEVAAQEPATSGSFAAGGIDAATLKTIDVDTAWLSAQGPAPYLLTSAQTEYVLQTDVTVDGTAFVVANSDIVLDLNGHAVTYGNAAPMIVNNGGFEQGTAPDDVPGWDLAQAPGATRVGARAGMWGNWMLRVPDVASTSTIVSDAIAIPQANREYAAAVTAKSVSGAWVRLIVVDAVTGQWLGSDDQFGVNRGFSNVAQFTPATTNPVKLLVRMEPPNSRSVTFDLDYAAIMPSRDYGVVATRSYWALPGHLQTSEITSSVSNVRHFTLENGTLQQGAARGYGSSPVFAQSHTGLTVDGVDIMATGMDTNNLEGPWAKDTTVINSILRAEVDRLSDRTQLFGAIKLYSANGRTRIENNQILDVPQSGIVVGPAGTVEIVNNEIRQNAIVTNGYAVNVGGSSVTVIGNTIIPVHGRGIMLDTASTGNTNGGVIANNYVEAYEVANLEYGRFALEATALRIRVFSGNAIRNLHIHNNTFFARTDDAGVWGAIGMRITHSNGKGLMDGANNLIENNHFKAIVNSSNSAQWARAVSVSHMDSNTGLEISRNVMESNHTSLGFGDNDSYADTNNDILMVGNTILKSSDGPALPFKGISAGWMRNAVRNVRLIDTRFANGAGSNIVFEESMWKDVAIGWLLNVTVLDDAAAPVSGALVEVFDTNGTLVFSGLTDGAGQINGMQLIAEILRQTGSNPNVIDREALTPHRVEVSHANFVTAIRTIALDRSMDLTVNLSGSSAVDRVLRISGDTLNDVIALRLSADGAELEVDRGNDGVADQSYLLEDFDSILVDAKAGDDLILIDESRGVFSASKDTTLDGGSGNDAIIGGTGAESLMGGSGNDTLEGGDGDDEFWGGAGDDSLAGGAGSDTLRGNGGDDLLLGQSGDDAMDGGTGSDVVYGHDGNDTLWGKSGDDRLFGGEGDDVFAGFNPGFDSIDGGAGYDRWTLRGTDSDDLYEVDWLGSGAMLQIERRLDDGTLKDRATGRDIEEFFIMTLNGQDRIDLSLLDFADLAVAGLAEIRVNAGKDNDTVIGSEGGDSITGGAGDDALDAGAGFDTIEGGAGIDTCFRGELLLSCERGSSTGSGSQSSPAEAALAIPVNPSATSLSLIQQPLDIGFIESGPEGLGEFASATAMHVSAARPEAHLTQGTGSLLMDHQAGAFSHQIVGNWVDPATRSTLEFHAGVIDASPEAALLGQRL